MDTTNNTVRVPFERTRIAQEAFLKETVLETRSKPIPPVGLGDAVEWVIRMLRLDSLVKGKGSCGCRKRKALLNRILPRIF